MCLKLAKATLYLKDFKKCMMFQSPIEHRGCINMSDSKFPIDTQKRRGSFSRACNNNPSAHPPSKDIKRIFVQHSVISNWFCLLPSIVGFIGTAFRDHVRVRCAVQISLQWLLPCALPVFDAHYLLLSRSKKQPSLKSAHQNT